MRSDVGAISQSREEERVEHSLEHDARKAKIALDNAGTPGVLPGK